MASGTADLQRDLGGAIMQSIFGALLASGYASSLTSQIGSSPDADQVSSTTEATLTKSFSSAEALSEQYPQYADQIISAARTAFLQGDNWAYVAGVIATIVGAAVIFWLFPRRDDERRMLAEYAAADRDVA
jgi:hypothetical protein